MAIDWSLLGQGLMGLVVGIGGWFAGRKTTKAKTETEVAKARAEGAQAAAETSVVDMMRQEVERLGKRVAALESREARLIRQIYRLEGLMRGAGMEPPHFELDTPE